MMLNIPVLLFMMLFANNDLTKIRILYSEVSVSESGQQEFIQLMQGKNSQDATILAYKGAASVLQSRSSKDKNERKSLFIRGIHLIEDALSREPGNIEIRLIRLSIQENIPKVLNYSGNIEEDVAEIRKLLESTRDKALKEFVAGYIQKSKSF